MDRHPLPAPGFASRSGCRLPRPPARRLARALRLRARAGAALYTRLGGAAAARSDLWAAASRHLRPIEVARSRPGDVLLFRMKDAAVAKHLGIVSAVGETRRASSTPTAATASSRARSRRLGVAASSPRSAFPSRRSDGDTRSFGGRRGGGRLAGRHRLRPVSTAVIGRAIGATVGRVIDQRILGDGSRAVETGRVDRFRLTGASEGAPISQHLRPQSRWRGR